MENASNLKVIDFTEPTGAEGQRNLQGSNVCVTTRSLQTPSVADTVVIGTMFTVQTHKDPLTMLTMEISANPLDTKMDVQIYTKIGDFKGAESDPLKWTKIVDTSVTPAREGRGTIIPTEDFKTFTMNSNEQRSFFISLKTSDLRYRRADDLETGQQFLSDGFLSVNVGIGLSEYGFGNQFFPSRMFSGIFHYTYATDCNAPTSKTLVTYSFYAQPKGQLAPKTEVIDELDRLVGNAIEGILGGMGPFRDEHGIKVEDISTVEHSETKQNGKFSATPLLGRCLVTHDHNFLVRWLSCIDVEIMHFNRCKNYFCAQEYNYIGPTPVPLVAKLSRGHQPSSTRHHPG